MLNLSIFFLFTLIICRYYQLVKAFQLDRKTECNRYVSSTSSQTQVLDFLTQPCVYDQHENPSLTKQPVIIYARVYVYYIKYEQSQHTPFKAQLLLQLRWNDPRLKYDDISKSLKHISGEHNVASKIWIPNLYLTNEKLAEGKHRALASANILPDGTVLYVTRWKANLICRSKLGKFPFDKQKCHLNIDTWKFHSEELFLEWEKHNPVMMGDSDLFLTEYRLVSAKSTIHSFIETDAVKSFSDYNCSALAVSFLMSREYGFYIMDYYVPSVLLVIVSWVSFWAAPDATPSRATLGSATMLTFISLSVDVGKSLPNVSYIRSNDLWFIGCTAFIFFSLAEFAFVNTIWRYGTHRVEMKKATSKYILKSTMKMKSNLLSRRMSVSCPASPTSTRKLTQLMIDNERTVKSLSELDTSLPMPELQNVARESFEIINEIDTPKPSSGAVTSMTMQEIAIWIDKKSRIVFPLSFVIFNIIYWGLLNM